MQMKCARYSGHMHPHGISGGRYSDFRCMLCDFRCCQVAVQSDVQVCTPSGSVREFWFS